MIQPTDIVFTFSNGSNGPNNSNPNLSLGSTPSAVNVGVSIENLFESLSTEDAQNGRIDYRCFYVFNDSASENLPSTAVYFDSQLNSTAQLNVGVSVANEQQKLTVSGVPSGGSIKLTYDGDETSAINYGGSPAQFATNIATQLNALAALSGITCVSTDFGSYSVYDINFTGDSGNRYHPILSISNNSLSGSVTLSIVKSVNGSPINTVAPLITNSLNAPAGISFRDSGPNDRINIGLLGPTEGFPIWVRRIVPAGTFASSSSGATFKVYGVPI
jgi:hypothetical protein